MDLPITGRPEVGRVYVPLVMLKPDSVSTTWVPLSPLVEGQEQEGELKMELCYKPFVDDEVDTGYRLAEQYEVALSKMSINDIKTASQASSRAAVVASAAYVAL